MDIETSAPDGSGGFDAPVTITPASDTGSDISVSQAARALAAARHKPKEPAPVEVAEAAPVEPVELSDEDNAAPVEKLDPGEATEDAKPADEPPIERPRSWTKEEDTEWQSLPRAMQQKIVAREQERDAGLRRSQNEAAERLKGLTAKEQAAEQVKQQYEAKLPAIEQMLLSEQAANFPDIKSMADIERYANEALRISMDDPVRAGQIQAYLRAWDTHQQKLQLVTHDRQQAEQRQKTEQSQKWAETKEQEGKLFDESLSDSERAQAKALQPKAGEYLQSHDFKAEELNAFVNGEKVSPLDHRMQRLIFKAMMFDEIQKAKTTVTAKPVPPVQRPGTARPLGQAAAEQAKTLTNRLNETGSIKDATAALLARRSQRRAS